MGQKCLRLFEASQTSEKHISYLEQENADSAKFYETQLASLEYQLHLLQKEAHLSKNLYYDELDTTLRAKIEISVLHICLQELHANNTYMGQKCLRLFKASQTSEKHISYLEQENADSAKFYLSQLANLEYKLHLLQEEAQLSKNLYNDELDTTLRAEIEISILHECLQELHGNNTSMGHKCLQLFEASQTSEKHISYLEQENADSAKFYQTQLASLEYQLHLLQEEAQFSKNLYYDELDTTLRAEIEISVLHNCLRDLHGNNTSLGQKCLQLFEASQTLEKHITSLTQQNADQQVDSKALLDVLDKLRVGFSQMATILDFDVGIRHGCMYGDLPFSIQSHANQILETFENVEKALTATLDEKQQLVLEKSVLITLLQQIKLEVVEINAEKCIISQNLKAGAQRLLKLSTEVQGHLEANEELRRTVEDEDFREKMLRDDIQELSSNMLDLQWSYQTLQQANNSVLVENKCLMTELANFKGANCVLEEEICDAIGDALSLNNIALVFQDFFSDKLMEVKELEESMHQLHQIKDTLQDVIKELEEKLQLLLDDKSHLMESIAESDNELKTLRSINGQLNVEVSNGKELLHQKETDFSEMKLKLETLLNEQTRLQLANEDLKREYEMMAVIKEEQAVLIFKLATENGMKSAENADLRASQHCLETELLELINKHENVKTSEVALESELQRWKTKELLYEKEYEGLFREHQISAILEACYHEKFQELHKKYESTTSKISSMDLEAQLLKQKLTVLEVENAGLKAHFNEYDSAVKSLSNSMASLESQAILHEKLSKINLTKDAELKQVHVQDKSDAVLATGCTELKDLQSRIQAVELAVDDIQKLRGPIDLVQSSLLPTKELESGSSFRLESAGARRQIHHYSDASSEINEFPKDIMLDQISDCSPYGLSSKEITGADTRILELWGTTNKDSSDATGQKLSSGKRISSSEITAEKEMTVVDKLEIPTSREDPQQTGKKVKILERLHFDAEKLANIQKSVQNLKSKVGIAEKSKKTKGVIEYDTVKEQLDEAEEAIEKLFGVNKKLTRTVEDESVSLKSENGSEESSTVRRRRVLEQIRRASEKISRLHFEVQKLQFLLQKLEGEKEVLVKTRIIPRSPRVRLRDYLYGSSGQVFSHKQKGKRFCGCIQPSTKGD